MSGLNQSANFFLTFGLKVVFYVSLVFLVISFSWNAGWNVVGDPYSLGPFLPWLELVFPFSGLALWGLFFSQWALGELRRIHVTRWFYLLVFVSVLMLNVLFSVHPESSLGYLSIWLTASLALSLQLEREFKQRWVWYAYAAGITLSFVSWYLYPPFINVDLLLMSTFLGGLHVWQQSNHLWVKLALIILTLGGGAVLGISLGLKWLLVLAWLFLLWKDYRLYRRKLFWLWGLVVAGIITFIGLDLIPNLNLYLKTLSATPYLGDLFSWWHGVGIGQFEWAQFQAQTNFQSPSSVVTNTPLLSRWWFEAGGLMGVLIPTLWLLTLGHGQNFQYRTLLFWGIVVLAPNLWLSPGGIILGAFWFFNRQSWKSAKQSSVEDSPKLSRHEVKRRGLKLHWPVRSQDGRAVVPPEAEKPL